MLQVSVVKNGITHFHSGSIRSFAYSIVDVYKRQRLRFLLAPMVHWPEVMAAYEEEKKILFSADAFGRFGSLERTAHALSLIHI